MSSMASAAASAVPTAVVKAPPQGGVLEGVNPVHFDAKNPIILFIVQVGLLLVLRWDEMEARWLALSNQPCYVEKPRAWSVGQPQHQRPS
jgi:hypothetical protein